MDRRDFLKSGSAALTAVTLESASDKLKFAGQRTASSGRLVFPMNRISWERGRPRPQ